MRSGQCPAGTHTSVCQVTSSRLVKHSVCGCCRLAIWDHSAMFCFLWDPVWPTMLWCAAGLMVADMNEQARRLHHEYTHVPQQLHLHYTVLGSPVTAAVLRRPYVSQLSTSACICWHAGNKGCSRDRKAKCAAHHQRANSRCIGIWVRLQKPFILTAMSATGAVGFCADRHTHNLTGCSISPGSVRTSLRLSHLVHNLDTRWSSNDLPCHESIAE